MRSCLRLVRLVAALLAGAVLTGGAAAGAPPATLGLVINEDGNSIAAFDPTTGRVLGTIVSGAAGGLNKPHLAAYDPASKRLYVGNKGGNLVVFDLADVMAPKQIASAKPGGDGEIHWVVLAAGLVWLAHEGDSAVYAYDPADLGTPRAKLGKDRGLDTTHGLALRPGTSELWSSNRPTKAPGFILRVDAATRSVTGQPLRTTGQDGDRPNNVGFTPDGRWAYAVNTGAGATKVTVIDAAKFEVVAQIEQDATWGLAPHAITYDPASRRMFVVNKDSPTLSAIDVASNTVAGYVTIGDEPHGVTRGPDGLIYTTAKKARRITAVDPHTLAVAWETMNPALIGPHQIVFVEPAIPGLPSTGAGPPDPAPWWPATLLGLASLATAAAVRRLARRRA